MEKFLFKDIDNNTRTISRLCSNFFIVGFVDIFDYQMAQRMLQ